MKSFCFVLCCCALFAGGVEAQPVPAQVPPAQVPPAQVPPAQVPPALTDVQTSAIRALQSESGQKTTQLAVELAAVVQKIYDNNLADAPNEELRVTLDNQMKELVWQMLVVRGNSMWAAYRLLTPEQKGIVRTEIAKPRPPGDLPDVLELIVKTFKPAGR
jgi:hypothetical protein